MIFDRNAIAEIRRRAQSCRVLLVSGAHGNGKSVATRAAMTDYRHVDLASAEVHAKFEADPFGQLKAVGRATVIDHAERLPRVFDALAQYATLREDVPPVVVVTSIDPGESLGSLTEGSDRTAVIEIGGLSVDEVHPAKPTEGWRQLWLRGGAPEAYLGNFVRWHERNTLRIADEIGTACWGAPEPAAVVQVLRALAGMQAQNLVLNRVARVTGLDKVVVVRVVEALVDRFVIRLMRRFGRYGTEADLKSPVLYFRDTGMLHSLSGIGIDGDLERHPLRQASWESFVIGESIVARCASGADDESVAFVVDKGECLVPLAEHPGATLLPCFILAGLADGRFLAACRARTRLIGARRFVVIDFAAMTRGEPRFVMATDEQPQVVNSF